MTDNKIKIDRRDLAEKAAVLQSRHNPIIKTTARDLGIILETRKNLRASRRLIAAAYCGISHETLRTWVRGEVDAVDVKSLQRIVEGASAAGYELGVEDFLPATTKYDLGEKLEMDFRLVQRIVDKEIFSNQTHVRGFYLDPDAAEDLADRFKGLYHLYHTAPPAGGASGLRILKSTLRVRYELPISKEVAVVRCKLHVPKSNEHNDFAPYDGVLTRRGNHIYWYFEEVSRKTSGFVDMVNIICKRGVVYTPPKLTGVYMSLTSAQQIYCASAYLERMPFSDEDDRHTAKKYFRDDLRVYSEQDFASIPQNIMQNLESPYTPLSPLG